MSTIDGFAQEKIREIWDSLAGEKPFPGAKRVVDDEHEQVMTISTENGQVAVQRRSERDLWRPARSVGDPEFE